MYNSSNASEYAPLVYLKEPDQVAEDHMTFLFGCIMLFSVAVGCVFLASRVSTNKYKRSRSSVIVLLGSIHCTNDSSTHTTTSFVSTPNVIPSYQSLSTSPATGSPAPPPYQQFWHDLT